MSDGVQRRRSFFQGILSKFFYSETASSKSSALCSNEADADDVESVQLTACQPWDRRGMLARLRTFKPGTWFGKPEAISAVVCASYGWINCDSDTLECPLCHERLHDASSPVAHGLAADEAAQALLLRLQSMHSRYCQWAFPQPSRSDLIAFPAAPPADVCAAFAERVDLLAKLAALPALGGRGLSILTDGTLAHVLALLNAAEVPVRKAPEGCPDNDDSSALARHPFESLTRRSTAFAQCAKLLAALGWRPQPLPGREPDAAGLYAMRDCTLVCCTCQAEVGLWSVPAAPGTDGILGYSGLLGDWGPGPRTRRSSLKTISIAGGFTGPRAARPAGTHAAVPDGGGAGASAAGGVERVAFGSSTGSQDVFGREAVLADVPGSSGLGAVATGGFVREPFGARSTDPVFGASVSVGAAGARDGAGAGQANKADAQCGLGTAGVEMGAGGGGGVRRPRESDEGEGSDMVAAKAAKIVSQLFEEGVANEVVEQLQKAGLVVQKEGALDLVLSHQPWCPWIFPESRSGWRQLLRAVVQTDCDMEAPEHCPERSSPQTLSSTSAAPTKGALRPSTMVAAAHELLNSIAGRPLSSPGALSTSRP